MKEVKQNEYNEKIQYVVEECVLHPNIYNSLGAAMEIPTSCRLNARKTDKKSAEQT